MRDNARRRALRIAGFVLVGFVVGSLVLGTAKGNPFLDNVIYGLWTGVLAGAVVAVVIFAWSAARQR